MYILTNKRLLMSHLTTKITHIDRVDNLHFLNIEFNYPTNRKSQSKIFKNDITDIL